MATRATKATKVTKATKAGGATKSNESLASRRPSTLPDHLRRRRERIVAAALEVLRESDYDRVQMRDVAERAGVSLGTVYRYFTSKEHLYAAVLLAWSADFFARIRPADAQEAPTEAGSVEERLRRMLRRTARSAQRAPQMTRVEMILETSTDENARALHDEFSDQYRASMATALRGLDRETQADVLTVVFSVVYRSMRLWALGRRSVREVERDFDATVDLIFSVPPG
jgi:TetR/AcrR family transcriptional regulator, cholesterol catabolism regulator